MKNKMISIAKAQGISQIGFCSAEDYCKRAEMPNDLKGARSIIVCAFGYYKKGAGNISRYARGKDYHKVVIDKMQHICEFLNENGYFAKAFVDIGKLDERLLAQLSGIAFRGRNGLAINERLGSYFFIGYIATDCALLSDKENLGECKACGACEKACPLGALSGECFNRELCLSHITQKRGELSEIERSEMQKFNLAWGCDICQEVCPHNKNIEETQIEEFSENLIFDLDIDEGISNREFEKKYADRAFSWRGKGVLIRNQAILKEKFGQNEKS